MTFLTLDDGRFEGKRVLVRLDVNVPMQDGVVTDRTRIVRSLGTIKDLVKAKAKVILMSHLGRPDGQVNAKFSLQPVAKALSEELGQPVAFANDCVGDVALEAVQKMQNGDVLMLENTRFNAAEEENDPAFVKQLATLGDMYVNDAFGTAHRAHASTEGLATVLPAYAGRLMQEELDALQKALEAPNRPAIAILGGSKISTKLDIVLNLVEKVDALVIGGAMANTLLYAQGINVGRSLCEKDLKDTALSVIAKAKARGCQLVLPVDAVVSNEFSASAPSKVVAINAIEDQAMMLDIGPASVKQVEQVLKNAKTVVWNGPVGAFEMAPFAGGTIGIAQAIANLTKTQGLVSVAGGGDTIAALAVAKVENDLSYVSTAGGAFLEWLEGKALPGVEALKKSARLAA